MVSVNCVSRITTNSVTEDSAQHDTALNNIDPGDVLPEVEWTIETPGEPLVHDDVIQDGKHSLNIARSKISSPLGCWLTEKSPLLDSLTEIILFCNGCASAMVQQKPTIHLQTLTDKYPNPSKKHPNTMTSPLIY